MVDQKPFQKILDFRHCGDLQRKRKKNQDTRQTYGLALQTSRTSAHLCERSETRAPGEKVGRVVEGVLFGR